MTAGSRSRSCSSRAARPSPGSTRNGNGRLSFEEWAVRTAEKFAEADADRSGWLDAAEYETSRPKPKARPKCKC